MTNAGKKKIVALGQVLHIAANWKFIGASPNKRILLIPKPHLPFDVPKYVLTAYTCDCFLLQV